LIHRCSQAAAQITGTSRPDHVIHFVQHAEGTTHMQLEIKKIGNSTGLILPKEFLTRHKLKQGDHVIMTETPDGLKITLADETFANGMEIARKAMGTYRHTLKELAK
jgi:putative addiction module antidote